MKYLIKFNEGKSNNLNDLFEDMKICFAELIDDNLVEVERNEYTKDNIFINIYLNSIYKFNKLEEYLDNLNKRKNLIEDIIIALNRLKDDWSEINIDISEFDKDEYISIAVNLADIETGEFYTKRLSTFEKDGKKMEETIITLNSDKLREILKLDKDTYFSCNSGYSSNPELLFILKMLMILIHI